MKNKRDYQKLVALATVSGLTVEELLNPRLCIQGAMLMDLQGKFSEDQALTVTAVSTNVIDLGVAGRDIGKGVPIEVLVQHVADAGGTSPTIIAVLQVDDNAAFSSAKEVDRSTVLADALAGDQMSLQWIPKGTDERYMRLNYIITGTSPTHTVNAGIVMGKDQGHGF